MVFGNRAATPVFFINWQNNGQTSSRLRNPSPRSYSPSRKPKTAIIVGETWLRFPSWLYAKPSINLSAPVLVFFTSPWIEIAIISSASSYLHFQMHTGDCKETHFREGFAIAGCTLTRLLILPNSSYHRLSFSSLLSQHCHYSFREARCAKSHRRPIWYANDISKKWQEGNAFDRFWSAGAQLHTDDEIRGN